jgi:quercetin dioxygenase-like cupin family protein
MTPIEQAGDEEVAMATTHDDPTRVYTSEDRAWIPMPNIPEGEGYIKVILADPERKVVIFKFRFAPGTTLVPHTHKCHAVAYTISGEWEYEGLKLPVGALAYEPVDSTHTPSSEPGAELVVTLTSETDQFLVNHMPDGSEWVFDMAFFQQLEGISPEEAQKLVAAMEEERGQA